ncbi:MAG: hypothetical protein GY862_30560 [Gammaproteobacteria bacterium]|nr:hypothetical protein [Gammaproteobacteria bacterium]
MMVPMRRMGTRKASNTGTEVSVPPNWFPCAAWEPERLVHGSDSFRAAQLVPMRRMGTRKIGKNTQGVGTYEKHGS